MSHSTNNLSLQDIGVSMSAQNYARVWLNYDIDLAQACATIPTGIASISHQAAITLFPNPAVDFIQINAPREISTVRLLNMTGKLRQTEAVTGSNTRIDATDLAPMPYIMQINFADGSIEYERFIKR